MPYDIKTKTNSRKSEKKSGSPSIETWQQRYSKAASNQEKMFSRFAQWYDIMYAVINTKDFAPWRSKVYIPILASKAWAIIAKFLNIKPGFEITVRDEARSSKELEEIADRVQKKLEYDYDNPDLDEPMRDKLFNVLADAIVTGQGLAKVPFVVQTKEVRQHPILDGVVDLTTDIVTAMKMGYNDLEPVNIFNVFMAPSAVSLHKSPWVIIKEYKTLADLKAINEEAGMVIYENLDKLEESKAAADTHASYKASRNRLMQEEDPVAADDTVTQIEIYECYDKASGYICTYAANGSSEGKDAWTKLREQKNFYWHGKYPLVPFYVRKRPYQFWGESIFQTSHRLQSAVNDIFNHYMDNWNLSIDGMIMIEENSQASEYIVGPGEELVYKGEQPKQFKFAEPNPNQLATAMAEVEKAIEAVTISQYATGVPDSSMDKTAGTATGVTRLQEAAGEIIGFMRANFQGSVTQVGRMFLSNNRQFLDAPFTAVSLKNNKVETSLLTPEELQLDMDLKLNDATMEPLSKQEARDNLQVFVTQLMNLAQMSAEQAVAQGDPTVALMLDYHEIAQDMGQKYGVRNFAKYLSQPNEPLPPEIQALAVEAGVELPGMGQMMQPGAQPEAQPEEMMQGAPSG